VHISNGNFPQIIHHTIILVLFTYNVTAFPRIIRVFYLTLFDKAHDLSLCTFIIPWTRNTYRLRYRFPPLFDGQEFRCLVNSLLNPFREVWLLWRGGLEGVRRRLGVPREIDSWFASTKDASQSIHSWRKWLRQQRSLAPLGLCAISWTCNILEIKKG
jgi:hypothetical protein